MAGDGPSLSDFDYHLPVDRIAQEPARPRDASRLMVLDRGSGRIAHHRFTDLADLLCSNDVLVVNDTRVIPAALTARRATGARIDGTFLRVLDGGAWEVMLAGRGRLREGETLSVVDAAGRPRAEIRLAGKGEGGVWRVIPPEGADALRVLREVGRPPLPPYIRRRDAADPRTPSDRDDYQTVYARADGAVAAPTAGLHFTPRVLAALDSKGIERTTITLHVGPGTFLPIRAERLVDHKMHAEHFEVTREAADLINRARAEGRRIVAVGTTTVRALESAAGEGGVRAAAEWTRLFIHPPYEFRVVGAMLTNFHLPRSTLLAMVSAFVGRECIFAAYEEAKRKGYRFYSYGDAMLIV